MTTRQELIECKQDRIKRAQYHRTQLLADLAIAGTGLVCIGIGIRSLLGGDIAGGVAEITLGGGFAIGAGKTGIEEIKEFGAANTEAGAFQSQANQPRA